MAAVLVLAAAQFLNLLPTLLNFERFAFGDCGLPLTTDVLIAERGQVPVRDFTYYYGLLTLAVCRGWFAAFGRSPEALVGLYAVCSFAIALGAARVMAALELKRWPSLFLIACTSSIVIPRGFPSAAHALEAAFLMSALAAHSRGRLDRALALCVLAVMTKASLGYFYGLILVLLVLAGWPAGSSRWKRFVLPAITAALLGSFLAGMFGTEPLLRTLFPLDGLKVYSDEGVGFLFGAGRPFWLPDEPNLQHYLGIPGVWLASSVVLFISAIVLLPRIRENGENFAITCAVLHAVFVFLLFGNQWSWIYYPFVLFVGTAVALDRLPRLGNALAVFLTIASVVGQANWIWSGDFMKWIDERRSPVTAGLYAPPEEIEAWEAVRRKEHVFVFTRMGCPQLLAPEVSGPEWWCLIRQVMKPGEVRAVQERIAAAEWIVSPGWHDNDLMEWPEFAKDLKPFREEGSTPYFRLFRRIK